MNEKLIEKKLRDEVRQRGGLALKFTSPSFTGVPDRLVLMPGGQAGFAEIKTTGKKLTERQEVVKEMLEKLGFPVYVIDGQESLNGFLKSIE